MPDKNKKTEKKDKKKKIKKLPLMNHELLAELTDAIGISGFESDEIHAIVKWELESICDSVKIDNIGNVIGFKSGSAKKDKLKIMLAGHMDEIGYLVNHVDDNGFLRILPVGGHDPRNMMSQRVWVHTDKGEKLPGLLNLAMKPALILGGDAESRTQVNDYFVDLCMPADDVKEKVEIGDYVTMNREYKQIGDCVTNKAMDDRIGIFIMLEALKKVKSHKHDIYAVGTVQEEVGIRGAFTSSKDIKPDIGIALDITAAFDVLGTPEFQRVSKLREGICIKISDGASISDPSLVKEFRDLAKKKGIKHQMEILPRGGTDAGAMQVSAGGCRVITISIPTRYGHSPNETCSIEDIVAGIDLLAAWLEEH
jgi:putative aminopeptidase FrvX